MSHVSVGIHRHIRSSLYQAVKGLSTEQLQAMPNGFDNNIAWNLGHVLIVQQRLLYSRCGLPLSVPEEMLPLYLPGTSPADWQAQPDAQELVELLVAQQEQLEADYAAGRFQERPFDSYTTAFRCLYRGHRWRAGLQYLSRRPTLWRSAIAGSTLSADD